MFIQRRIVKLYWYILLGLGTMACGRVGYGGNDEGGDGSPSPTADADVPGDGTTSGTSDGNVGNVTVRAIIDGTDTADDGMIHSSNVFQSGQVEGFLELGRSNSSIIWAYWRLHFQQPVPEGARIQYASLRLWGGGISQDWDPTSDGLLIYGEMEGIDPPQVTSPDERPFTNNSGRQVTGPIRWPATGGVEWARDVWNNTPDLSTIVQTWVDTYGTIPEGATMQIWIRGDNVTNNHTLITDDSTTGVFNPTYEAAELTIEYSP